MNCWIKKSHNMGWSLAGSLWFCLGEKTRKVVQKSRWIAVYLFQLSLSSKMMRFYSLRTSHKNGNTLFPNMKEKMRYRKKPTRWNFSVTLEVLPWYLSLTLSPNPCNLIVNKTVVFALSNYHLAVKNLKQFSNYYSDANSYHCSCIKSIIFWF